MVAITLLIRSGSDAISTPGILLNPVEIFFPLNRQEIFLFIVAFLAGGHNIPL